MAKKNTLKIYNSTVPSNAPTSLEYGELAINVADEKLFYKNGSDVIKSLDLQANSYLPLTGGTLTGSIAMPNGHYVNKPFTMIENASPQWILLCRNAGNNDVSGTIRIDRTSGNYQSSIIEVIVSSGTSAMFGGTLRTLQVLQQSEDYRLVSVTYNSESWIAIKYTGNTYPMTTNGYFTGRIISSDSSPLPLTTVSSGISNEASFGGNSESYQEVDNFVVSGNIAVGGTVDGRNISSDGYKLDGIATNANNYSLPLSTNGTRGGVQIGYTENGKNYPVELSSEKMFVNVPWTDTVYSHPTYSGDDLDVDTGTLTGANVISDIDFSITTDTQGHVTDITKTAVSTRTLTLGDLGYTGETNATADQTPAEILTAIKTVDGSGSGLDADLLDGYNSNRFFRRVGKATATVGGGWMTVATTGSGRYAGEVIVTDADSGDHAYIRIHWMRSYVDSNFTVINCGGHGNRITGARVLYQTSDTTYGEKILQVYVTTSSNYEVNVYEIGDIDDYGALSVHTPTIENSISGYAVHGNELTGLDSYGHATEEGILAGGAIRSNNAMYVGSNQVWHSGNDGSGSGLDADTVDGIQGSSIVTTGKAIAMAMIFG